MKASVCISITESTQVGEARRVIGALASKIELSETLRGQVAIIVTELGNNLIKHTRGKGGQLICRALESLDGNGLEILAVDQGPGMADVSRCMTDGYSTAGSPGTGLGAVNRLSSVFDIHSLSGVGTAILSQVFAKPLSRSGHHTNAFEVGAVCLPIRGETVSGDGWETHLQTDSNNVLVVDGLGHGPLAFEAAQSAIRSFTENAELAPKDAIQNIHHALKSTRGAAVAVTQISSDESLVHYAGVGNIVGIIFSRSGEQRRMASHNGTAGVQIRTVQEFSYPWDSNSILVMHSDGISTHWGLEKYTGLLNRHPSIIAAVIHRDFSRGRDDSTVLVVSPRQYESVWKATA